MIKKFLQKTIVLASQIIMLVLAILWYLENKEIEPLIAIVSLSATIIISIFLKTTKDKTMIVEKFPRFRPQDGYIYSPLYIFSQEDLTLETLLETKIEIKKIIENYEFQIIEHQSEIEKLRITVNRVKQDFEEINTKINELNNQNGK